MLNFKVRAREKLIIALPACSTNSARLENVIMCPRATVGERSTLKDCDVASGVNVLPDTQAKMEKITGSAESESEEED